MSNREIDILIVGGGLIGATLMLALQGLGYSTLLVEAKPFSERFDPDFDARSLALSPASQRILKKLGVWDLLKDHVSPIDLIHISDQYHFGVSCLRGKPHTPLGYILEMRFINQALHQLLQDDLLIAPAVLKSLDSSQGLATILIDSREEKISARLIVAADGTKSTVRRLCALPAKTKHYEQWALVANIGLSKTHGQRAYERFTADGPLALLPMRGNRVSMVWAVPPQKAERLLSLSDTDFLQQLQQIFGHRLGCFTKVGKRFSYPLQQVLMLEQAKWPIVFVGNSAHTLHPVAGQGFNLGLRDVAALAQCIAQEGINAKMLEHYTQLRSHDQKVIRYLTDGLINLFTTRLPGLGWARGFGLLAFDNMPMLKSFLARYAQGFGGIIPDLVCEMALNEYKI